MQGFHRVWKSGKGEQDQICFSRLWRSREFMPQEALVIGVSVS
jgi:hypothetical protein